MPKSLPLHALPFGHLAGATILDGISECDNNVIGRQIAAIVKLDARTDLELPFGRIGIRFDLTNGYRVRLF